MLGSDKIWQKLPLQEEHHGYAILDKSAEFHKCSGRRQSFTLGDVGEGTGEAVMDDIDDDMSVI